MATTPILRTAWITQMIIGTGRGQWYNIWAYTADFPLHGRCVIPLGGDDLSPLERGALTRICRKAEEPEFVAGRQTAQTKLVNH